MPLAALTFDKREIIRPAMQATFHFFDLDFQTRLGIDQEIMRQLLAQWPDVDDASDLSDACIAINNSLNDLLNGIGIADSEAIDLVGAPRSEMERVYLKWKNARGW